MKLRVLHLVIGICLLGVLAFYAPVNAEPLSGCVFDKARGGDYCPPDDMVPMPHEYCSGEPTPAKPDCCCTYEAVLKINSQYDNEGNKIGTTQKSAPILPSFFKAPDLKVSIPGLSNFKPVTCDTKNCYIPWLAEYVAGLQRYAIAIIGLLAVIVIMIGGITWLTAGGNQTRIADAKKFIASGVGGVVLTMCAYLLLYTINPELTVLKSLQIRYIEKIDLEEISPEVYQSITGSEPMESFGPEMKALIDKVAKDRGKDSCFLYTFVAKESGGRVNVIGHDENVRDNRVKAHRQYVADGKTYKGVSFSGFKKNDDTPVCADKEDLCLDWRYSHGIGLVQITIFKADGLTKNGAPAKKIKGNLYSPKELFSPELSLHAAVDYLEESGCGENLKLCFQKYNGSGSMAEEYAAEASDIYNKCKSGQL